MFQLVNLVDYTTANISAEKEWLVVQSFPEKDTEFVTWWHNGRDL